ncbi:MAG TPA: MFS transporter [Mycobacteriales bacterium]|nr:MFS transporter [Mycobacteriales bacterium]
MTRDTGESPETAERVGHALWRLLVAIGSACRRGLLRLRNWNRRDGAGASGLAALVETHALQSAGDATITVALAGSLFFSVPTHEARSRVALYLLVTMAPFAVVAPVLGPLLDRVRHGRRAALALTMLARAALALAIGHSLGHGTNTSVTQALTLYPAALGVLVASKAYGIARSAAVPRLVPEGMTLVQANSRLTLAGVVAPGVAGGIAAAVITVLGHRTELLLGAAVYVVAAVTAFRLPRAADGGGRRQRAAPMPRTPWLAGDLYRALRTAASLRWLSGFLLLFGAFVVRVHPIGGLDANICLGELALGIGVGNVLGTLLGARTATVAGNRLSTLLLAATVAVSVFAALDFGVISVFALAVVGSAATAMSKLALDATIQRRVDDQIRTSTFARSETVLQLAWVVGGGIGIVLPTRPEIGFSVAAAVLAVAMLMSAGRIALSPSGRGDDALSQQRVAEDASRR